MSQQTRTRPHQWVAMSMTPVEVLGLDAQGDPAVMQTGDPQTVMACSACGEPLTSTSERTECEVEWEQDPDAGGDDLLRVTWIVCGSCDHGGQPIEYEVSNDGFKCPACGMDESGLIFRDAQGQEV